MKSITLKRHVILVLILCGVVLFQLKQMNDFQQQDYQAMHTLFEHEIRLDAESELNMMMLLNHHIYHYDELSQSLSDLHQGLKNIQQHLKDSPKLKESLTSLAASVAIQTESIESFKGNLGIYFNSERYLLTLTQQLIKDHPEHAFELKHLLALSYQYLLESDHQTIRLKIDKVLQHLSDFYALHQHIHILFDYSERVRENIQSATTCGTPENIHILSKEFDEQHAHNIKSQREISYILMAFILLLLGYYHISLGMC